MCGIVGYFDKTTANKTAVGQRLLKMLEALACRGPDSAGVAMFGSHPPRYLVAQVKLGDGCDLSERAQLVTELAKEFGGEQFSRAVRAR